MKKTFKTRCPHCNDTIEFDVDYILNLLRKNRIG